jgi:hypothetical protein
MSSADARVSNLDGSTSSMVADTTNADLSIPDLDMSQWFTIDVDGTHYSYPRIDGTFRQPQSGGGFSCAGDTYLTGHAGTNNAPVSVYLTILSSAQTPGTYPCDFITLDVPMTKSYSSDCAAPCACSITINDYGSIGGFIDATFNATVDKFRASGTVTATGSLRVPRGADKWCELPVPPP